MNSPKISVILPVYNAELYVRESIQSILDQTFSDFELIVLNDGSTDGSEKVILEFQDDRIKYIKNEINLKLIDTLNLGLKLAKGKYIARIDADDICFLDRFEKQISFLDKNPEYGIIGSFAEFFGDSNGVLKYVEEDTDIRFALLTHNPFIHSTIMFRRSILTEYQLEFRKDQLHVEDYDLWIIMISFTKAKIIPESLVKYRMHENQISSIHSEIQKNNTAILQKKYFTSIFDTCEKQEVLLAIFYCKFVKDQLDDFIKNREIIRLSLSSELQRKVFRKIETKSRDAYLELEQIEIKDFLSMVSLNNFFSLKQKMVLLFKLF